MILSFHIDYHTSWGQKLKVCGSLPELGNWDASLAPEMNPLPGGKWTLSLELPDDQPLNLSYKYLLVDDNNGQQEWEWGKNRELTAKAGAFEKVEMTDFWRPDSIPENAWFSSAFTQVLMRRNPAKGGKRAPQGSQHRFQLAAPRIDAGHKMCILGSDPALGAWDEQKAVVMDDKDFPVWAAAVKLQNPGEAVEYKYGIYDPKAKQVLTWEEGENRRTEGSQPEEQKVLKVVSNEKFRYPLGNWKGAGVAVPVFSLRSQQGTGVGEFADLKLLIDWAEKTGMKLVQILPINDTTATHAWTDSYPYAAISVFALHPMYLNLEKMGKLKDKKQVKAFQEIREKLNQLDTVDYEAVMEAKSRYFKLLYDQEKTSFLADAGFKVFFDENRDWLVPYAAFSALRDRFGTVDFSQWGDYAGYDHRKIAELVSNKNEGYDDFAVHYFIQYHLHQQLMEATQYARDKGVVLKGDIPIGIYRYSVDAWVAPQLYNMGTQAGAPPDAFAVAGQNWGFPTYNWHEMAKDGYAWWRKRLTQMATYFDAFRIDHILGFFRIWEIPLQHVEGLLGHFNPALPLSRLELVQRAGWFDYDRMCRPYIREHMLWERFGEHVQEVKDSYLEEYDPGRFRLRAEVDTQRKVEKLLALPADAPEDQQARHSRIRDGLYSLIAEVLLLEAPFSNGEAFNPRISMHHTRSFQELDPRTRSAMDALYIDYFYKRHDAFWEEQALVKLPAITNATDMLVCGEDLGMVPDCVPGVMDRLGMLSLEIQRMPKSPKSEFGHPGGAPYLSVVSTGSHDMSTLRGWWEEDRKLSQRFYNNMLGHIGEAPYFCEPWVCKEVLIQHLYSPAMWAIFPLQDLVAIDGDLRNPDTHAEQINVPANPRHYWRYRFHLDLETMMEAEDFNSELKQLVQQAGRKVEY